VITQTAPAGTVFDMGGALAIYWPYVHPCHEPYDQYIVLTPEGGAEVSRFQRTFAVVKAKMARDAAHIQRLEDLVAELRKRDEIRGKIIDRQVLELKAAHIALRLADATEGGA
jgi:hypothetical protein